MSYIWITVLDLCNCMKLNISLAPEKGMSPRSKAISTFGSPETRATGLRWQYKITG